MFNILTIFGIKGFSLGICEKEFGIAVNSYLLVFGLVKYDFKTKSLELFKPLYYLKEKY